MNFRIIITAYGEWKKTISDSALPNAEKSEVEKNETRYDKRI